MLPEELPPPDDETPDDESASDEHTDAAAATTEALRQAMAPFLEAQAEIVRKAMEPLTAAFASQFAEINRGSSVVSGMQDVLRRSLRPLQFDFLAQYDFGALKSLQEALARSLPRIDFAQLRQVIRRGTPPNWHDLDDHVGLSELLDITEAGLPTAWVPRAEVLTELIDATEADRPAVFAARRIEIIEDCRTVLKDVTSPELGDLVDILDEALTVADEGRLAAAQALAASVFDTILRHTIKPLRITGYYPRVKAEITNRHENASMAELRWGLVHVAAIAALEKFDHPAGDPIPTSFNRHASAHAVSRVQYTTENAMIALTLATSLVREAHQEIVDAATTP